MTLFCTTNISNGSKIWFRIFLKGSRKLVIWYFGRFGKCETGRPADFGEVGKKGQKITSISINKVNE